MIRLNPYIHFKDNAKEAMEFYNSIFGGKLTVNTFKEFHAQVDPVEENLAMHSMLEGDNGVVFMAADSPKHMGPYKETAGVSMSLSGDDTDTLTDYWNKLSAEARVEQPLEKSPWGDTFGMLTDKFGIRWIVNITGKKD